MDKPGAGAQGTIKDLAELVWKYFREDMTQAIQGSQAAADTRKIGRSRTQWKVSEKISK